MEPSARQLQRQRLKQFLAAKKNNMKVQKSQQNDMTILFNLLSSNDTKGFRQHISSKNCIFVLSFLTKSDDLLQSTLQKMIKSQFRNQYFEIINQWSKINSQSLQEKFMGIEKDDWKSKFQNFNHDLYKQIVVESQAGKTQQELVRILSESGTFFGILYKQYWNLIFIKQSNPREQQIKILLNQFIVPLAQELEKKQKDYKYKNEVLRYKNMLQLQEAWTTDNFKTHLANPEILVLKQFNYNFMHELFAKKKYVEAMELYQYIVQLAQKKDEYNELAEKCMNSFNSSDQTPIDICLSSGSYEEIIKLLAFVKQHDQICLSTHCLTKLLSNKKLTKDKQKLTHLIIQCIDGNIANRGFVERTYEQEIKSYKSKFQKQQITIQNIFKRYGQRFIIIFDRNLPLLDKNGSNSFPLLTFLSKYGDNADLKVLQLLFPQLLTRKIMKIKIFSLLKMYGTQIKAVKQFSEAAKDINDIIYYQQSILSFLPTIKNSQILEYFVNKMFINQFYIFEFKDTFQNKSYVSMTEQHFIFEYCIKAIDLSQNHINKMILEKIMQCKENEKKFQNYDLYIGLLKNMADKKWIKFTDSQEWLPRQIKAQVKAYLQNYPPEQLLQLNVSKLVNFEDKRKGTLNKLVRANQYFHVLFTDEQLQKRFSNCLRKYQHYKQTKNKNIKYIIKRFNQGDIPEDDSASEGQELEGCDQLIKKMRIQSEIQDKINRFKELVNIEDPELQNYQLGQSLESCSQVQNYKITFHNYDEKLEKKLIAAIENGINPRISCASANKISPKFIDKIYKQFFQRMYIKSVDFIDIFIRSEDQLEGNFTQILQKLRKNFLYRILYRALKLNTFDEKNRMFNRSVSFLLLTKIVERLKIPYRENFYLKSKMVLKFLQEVQKIIYNITWEQETKSVKAMCEQLDTYICKWHPYIRDQIYCTQLSEHMIMKAESLQILIRPSNSKLIKLQKKQINFETNINYYGRLFLLMIHTNQKKLHLPKFFKALKKEEIFIFPWWEIFIMKLEHTPLEQKKNIIRECLPFFKKENPKTVLHLPENLFRQINKLSLKDYMQVVEMVEDENLNMQILQKNFDQEKNVQHMFYAMKKYQGFKRIIIDKMTENPKQIQVIAICILLRPFDMEIQSIFMQQKNQQRAAKYDSITIWFKSNDQTFEIFLNILNKAIQKIIIPKQNNFQVVSKILKALFYSHMWNRIIKFMQKIELYSLPIAIQACHLMRGNIKSINKCMKEDNSTVQLINYVFKKLQNSLWDEELFTSLYMINYQQVFKVFKSYGTIKVENAIQCLKCHPQGATLWRKSTITIVGEKHRIKFSSYYNHYFNQKSWTIDLLIINIQIMNRKDQCRKLLRTIFLHQKCIPYYKQLTIADDYPFYAKNVLSSNGLKSLKKLPEEMRNLVYQNIKKIPNLNPQLIMQLIDDSLIKTSQSHILNILYSNNLNVIDHYVKKYPQINFKNPQFLASLNSFKSIGKRGFLGFLLNFRSQEFIISFLKKYKILENYPKDFYSQTSKTLLSYICIRKHTKILQYYLDYCRNQLKIKNITFMSGKEASLTSQGIMTLPIQIAVDSDFYEYYFLIKSSGEQVTTQFQYSTRFLLEQDLKKYEYIPQMKRRIQILNTLTAVLKNGRSFQYYRFYFQDIFCTAKGSAQEGGPKVYEKQSLTNFLYFICEGSFKYTTTAGIYERLSYLFINQDIIPKSILKEHYYNQYKITEALMKFQVENSSDKYNEYDEYQIFNDEFLQSNLLIYQPQRFLKYFSDYLLNSDHSKVYSFTEGIFTNLVLFEKRNQNKFMREYLQLHLVGYQEEEKERVEKNLYMKKATLQMCIKSLASGTGITLDAVRTIQNCPDKSNIKIIFELGLKLMQRSKKRAYNADVWDKIYKSFQKSQVISPSKKQISEEEINSFISGCIDEISSQIQNLQFKSLKQIFQKTINENFKKGAKPYQCYLAVLMSSFKIICDISEFKQQLAKIKAPQYANIQLYIAKQQKSKCQIFDGVLSAEVQLSILSIYQMKILSLEFTKALKTSVHKFFLRNISQDLIKINNFSAEQNRYPPLKGHNFKINLDTFREIQEYQVLQLLLQKKGEYELLLSLQQLQDVSTPSKQFTIYSLLDVYGPINLNQENISDLALQSIPFYKYEPLPNHKNPIYIEYRKNLPKISKQNELIKRDLKNYFTYFKQEVEKQHKSNLQFSNIILFSLVSKGADKIRDHVEVEMCHWSLRNILRCIGIVHSYSSDLKLKFDSTFDIEVSPKSLIQTLQQLSYNPQQILFKQLSEFLFHPRHQKIVQSLLLMIVEDAFNVMKVVKGIIFVHKITNKKSKNLFKLGETFSVSNFSYQIKDQLFIITMQICKNAPNEIKELQVYDCPELVSRKQFLDSIFDNTDFLTDYFLNKTAINQECVRISTNLSKKINSHVNISVDYKSLYMFVEDFRKTATIREIDTLITAINSHILHSFQSTLDNYLNSQQVALKYQVKLFNKFYSLKNNKPISQIQQASTLTYATFNHNANGISRVNIQIHPEKISLIKNMFLVQVYKSHFSSMVTQGMTFLFGYKNNKSPNVLKLANRNDINQVNIVDIAFMLLVTNSLPTQDQLKRDKIIRLFIADLNGFVYSIQDSVANKLLNQQNQQRSISELIPLIAPNILLHFPSEHLKQNQIQLDSPLVKIIQIPVGKEGRIKMRPQKAPPISVANQLKINIALMDNINSILTKLEKYFDKKLQFLIFPSTEARNVTLADMAKLVLFDLQYLFDHYMSKFSYSNVLQLRLSANTNHNILDNFFRKCRKQLFEKYFSKIKIQLAAEEGGVAIQNQTIVIRAKYNKNGQIISANAIQCYILEYLIKMEKPEDVKIVKYEQMSKQVLVKFLDTISLMKYQKQQIALAFKIASKLQVKLPQSYCIYIGQQDKKDIRLKDNILQLNFKSSNDNREFYSANRILSVILNKNPDIIEAIEKINYLPDENKIEVCNLQDEEVKIIFIDSKNEVHLTDQNLKQKISNKTLKINAPNFPFKEFYAITAYAVTWNTFYRFNQQQKIGKGKITNSSLNQEVVLRLKSNNCINLNACPIILNVKRPAHISKNDNFAINVIEGYNGLKMKLLSQNVCTIGLSMPYTCNAIFQYPNFINQHHENDSASIHFISNNSAAIEKTKFIQLLYRGKTIQAKKYIKEKEENSHQQAFIQPLQFKKVDDKEVKEKNTESMVYIVNDQSRKFLSRAGDQRIDFIQLCDIDGNPVQNQKIKVFFSHINNLCVIEPQIQVKGSMLGLKWKPKIRGHYHVFINDVCMNPEYQIGVSAAIADPSTSRVQPPKIKEICFAQQTQCTFTLRDQYQNIYTQLEETIIGDSLIIELESEEDEVKKYLKMKLNPIDKYGIKKVRFSIDNPKGDDGGLSKIKVLMNKMQMISFQLKIKGQALKQRKKNLDSDINALNKHFYKQIVVSRSKFMQNLIQTAKKSLHVTFNVKFQGQQGIDAGGLKRQFYDMLGNEYKSERNGFFKPTDITKTQYFLNPEILKNKISNETYMQLLGKYLANSILNGYLIGVNFSQVFIKMLYEDKIQFEDLLRVLSAEEAARYKYLLQAKPQQFSDLQLYFSIALDKKKGVEVDLIEDGRNIPVTAQNVKRYLQLLSEALLTKRFKESIENFRNGFNSVIDITVIRRWIRPNEFWCLTAGTKEITPQIVLQYITFSGGSEMHNGWFRRYISQANQQVLVGFLKFSSGSGSIDFNQTSKVTVTFENAGANPKKLPISHTCWKQIVVPKYKSYELMHKLLNAAFLFCSEGFGFG